MRRTLGLALALALGCRDGRGPAMKDLGVSGQVSYEGPLITDPSGNLRTELGYWLELTVGPENPAPLAACELSRGAHITVNGRAPLQPIAGCPPWSATS